MPNTRTLADIWQQMSTEERLCVVIDRFRADLPKVPRGPRTQGYTDAMNDVLFYVLDRNPLPGEDAN